MQGFGLEEGQKLLESVDIASRKENEKRKTRTWDRAFSFLLSFHSLINGRKKMKGGAY